ncbi:MAG: ATP-binding cassette domain-containing protein, partial [Clostridiales bacterium]|nr:ATP-binding cassette domain-containing protein [Clostridiales bacterium]
MTRPIETYSKGEIKKLEMARALSMPNNILFLDEPLN